MVGHHPITERSQVRFPVRAHVGLVLVGSCTTGNQSMLLSHVNVSLSPPPPPPSLKSISMSLVENKNKKSLFSVIGVKTWHQIEGREGD